VDIYYLNAEISARFESSGTFVINGWKEVLVWKIVSPSRNTWSLSCV